MHFLCLSVFVLWQSPHTEWNPIIWQIIMALIQSSRIKSFSVIWLSAKCSDNYVIPFFVVADMIQASACFPFHYQQRCLKTVIKVITVIQTSSPLPRKSMMSLNDRELLQFLRTLNRLRSGSWQRDQHQHIKFLCGGAVELAATPCSTLQSRMQCFLPLLRRKQQKAKLNPALWAQTWHAVNAKKHCADCFVASCYNLFLVFCPF